MLRARRPGGHGVVRQFPIGPNIAAFACRAAAPVIELGGSQHVDCRHAAVRDEFPSQQGDAVLRPWNTDVLRQGIVEQVVAAVASYLSPGECLGPAAFSPHGRGARGTSDATTTQRSRRLTCGVARLMDK